MYVIAYDIGTTGLKTCLYSIEDRVSLVAGTYQEYDLYIFEGGGAEQDAEQNVTCNVPYPANAWYAMATDETLPLEDRDEAAKQLELYLPRGSC